ncbi:MAG: phosphatidylserine decarboxylase [SAR324 cluster bacterium]|nr:phosphatidylserine decarboxylase [SAR324 cluster bacterium]
MRYLLLRLLPKNLLSRLAGFLADIDFPSPILSSFIQLYSQICKVKLHEMKTPVGSMRNFNDFFTRELKPELRPIDATPGSVVSPVDGRIAEFGKIEQGFLVQAKGVLYSLNDLVGEKSATIFQDGYFLTIYLSPADYHRIHLPISGKIRKFSYISGNLWPVNSFGVKQIGGLFSLNERIITPIEGEHGIVSLVKVGATIVGKIKVNYNDLSSNGNNPTQFDLPVIPVRTYHKGDEIGRFQLGSTVILLFEKGKFKPASFAPQSSVKVGQIIGILKN